MKTRLYDEYIKRLLEVNDEDKTEEEHRIVRANLMGWVQGVEDAKDYKFNGDYYYIDKFTSGELPERPICCGVFLDWKSNVTSEAGRKRNEQDG